MIDQPEFPEICTQEFIKEFIEYITEISGDDERAHIQEDNLYYYVLKSISTNKCDNPMQCCIETLKTEEIEFNRWHA